MHWHPIFNSMILDRDRKKREKGIAWHVDEADSGGRHEEARKYELWLLPDSVRYVGAMDCRNYATKGTVCSEFDNT